jgi:hypothetical protein
VLPPGWVVGQRPRPANDLRQVVSVAHVPEPHTRHDVVLDRAAGAPPGGLVEPTAASVVVEQPQGTVSARPLARVEPAGAAVAKLIFVGL